MTHPADKISILVHPQHLPEESSAQEKRFVFAYTIRIQNDGDVPAKLLSRHWVITDSNSDVQEVRGEGVVGEQPLIAPGDHFQYTSGAIIATEFGTMEGEYLMELEDGTQFEAPIPAFTLTVANYLH